MNKKRICAAALIVLMGITGCQKSPKTSIVKNKNMDTLIEKAKNFDDDMASMDDMRKYDTYQTSIQDESLNVTVNVDAKIDVPQSDKMSVARVKQTTITQEFLDKVREKLLGDEKLYDGSILFRRTKMRIEEEIREVKQGMERSLANMEEENKEQFKKDTQKIIDELQEEYEKAPNEFVFDAEVSDGKFYNVAEMFEQNPKNELYMWQNSHEIGESFYGITDGKNGKYSELYVSNHASGGDCLHFRSGKHGYDSVLNNITMGTLLTDQTQEVWKADEPMPAHWAGTPKENILKDEKLTISSEEARKMADTFMEEIGLSDFQYEDGGVFYDNIVPTVQIEGVETEGCRPVYILRYMRVMDGVNVTFSGDIMYGPDSWAIKAWAEECVEFRINDDGIVEFAYLVPVEVTEKIVDGAAMKSFEEIKDTFEQIVVAWYANEHFETVINVDRVVLGYSRIAEPDSFGTGLLVPVWDFQGTITIGGQYKGKSVLAINAIDGTVINRSIGY